MCKGVLCMCVLELEGTALFLPAFCVCVCMCFVLVLFVVVVCVFFLIQLKLLPSKTHLVYVVSYSVGRYSNGLTHFYQMG